MDNYSWLEQMPQVKGIANALSYCAKLFIKSHRPFSFFNSSCLVTCQIFCSCFSFFVVVVTLSERKKQIEKKWRGLISRLFLQKRGICLPVNISSQFYNSPFLQNEIQLSIYVEKSCQWDSSNREAIFCSKNGELLPFGYPIQHKWTIIIVL